MKSNSSAPCEKAENRPFIDTSGEINSEEDYNSVSSQLADELMRENTSEELALALAQHLIYVDELKAVILEQQCLIRKQECLMQGQDAVTVLRERLIIKESFQAATKTATLTAIAIRRILPRILTSNAAKAKHAASTKAREKEAMRECWEAWQADPKRYGSKAAFARDMLDKFPDWLNAKVIEGFCRGWERGREEK